MSFTRKEFWNRHAPDFNFELNEQELLNKALERGFIKVAQFAIQVEQVQRPGLYKYNPDCTNTGVFTIHWGHLHGNIHKRLSADVRLWFHNYLNEGVPKYEDFGYVTLFNKIEMAHLHGATDGLGPIRPEDVRHVRNHVSNNPCDIITAIGGYDHPQKDTRLRPVCDISHSVRHERSLRDQVFHLERMMRDMDNHMYYPTADGDYLEYGVTGWDSKPVVWSIDPLLKHNKEKIMDLQSDLVDNDRDKAIRKFYGTTATQLKQMIHEEVTNRMHQWEDAQ